MPHFLSLSRGSIINLSINIDDIDYYPLIFKHNNINTLSRYFKSNSVRESYLGASINTQSLRDGALSSFMYKPDVTRSQRHNLHVRPSTFNLEFPLRRFTLEWNQGVLLDTTRYNDTKVIGFLALNGKFIKALVDYYFQQHSNAKRYNRARITNDLLDFLSLSENVFPSTLNERVISSENRVTVNNHSPYNMHSDLTDSRTDILRNLCHSVREVNAFKGISKLSILKHGLVFIHTPAFNELDTIGKEFASVMNALPIEVSDQKFSEMFLTPNSLQRLKLKELVKETGDIDKAEKQLRLDAKEVMMNSYNLKEKEEEPGKKGSKAISSLDELFNPDGDILVNDFNVTVDSEAADRSMRNRLGIIHETHI